MKAAFTAKEVVQNNEYLTTVENLASLAGQLREEGSDTEAKELFSQASQSVNIKKHNIKQQVLYAGIAYANLKLRENNLNREKKSDDAKNNLKEADVYLKKMITEDDSPEGLQVKILKLRTEGSLSKQNKDNTKAIEFYQKAFDTLKNLTNQVKGKDNAVISPPFNPNIKIKLLSKENIEALHREFMGLLQKTDKNYLTVSESLKQHFYDELENLMKNKKWQQADEKTSLLILYIAKREEDRYLGIEDIYKFPCQDLQKIDKKWLKASDNIFGFSLQKDIWIEETKKEGLDLTTLDLNKIDQDKIYRLDKAYQRFATRVGWYDKKMGKDKDYSALEWSYNAPEITVGMGYKSHLPTSSVVISSRNYSVVSIFHLVGSFFSRAAICKL